MTSATSCYEKGDQYIPLYLHLMSESKTTFNKTRIAPTPSGYLHLGNVLSFALTAAIAQQTDATILLRIDDLDRGRVHRAYVEDIFDTLNFLEIPWHEGPRNYAEYEKEWSQIHRMPLYNEALQQLKDQHNIFACSCSRAQLIGKEAYPGTCRHANLDFNAENISWRLDTSEEAELKVKTLNDGIVSTTLPDSMQDFVVRKKDGFPAYQLSSVIDDVHFDIDLIIRGADLWPSTLGQHYLALKLDARAFLNSTFYHHPILMESGDQKLSKSAGSTSIKYLREQGKKPTEVYQEILKMAGAAIDYEVSTWQQLAEAITVIKQGGAKTN